MIIDQIEQEVGRNSAFDVASGINFAGLSAQGGFAPLPLDSSFDSLDSPYSPVLE